MDSLNYMSHEMDVPSELRRQLREYIREARSHEAMERSRKVAMRFSPFLRGKLMLHLSQKWINQVWYFKDAPTQFVIEIAENLRASLFARREGLSDVRFQLCVMERGTIARAGRIHVPGSIFQEDMILSNRALQENLPTIALTYVEVCHLTRQALESVLEGYPVQQRTIRKAAVLIAFRRALILVVRSVRQDTPDNSLLGVFDSLDLCGIQASSMMLDNEADGDAHILGPLNMLRHDLQELRNQVAPQQAPDPGALGGANPAQHPQGQVPPKPPRSAGAGSPEISGALLEVRDSIQTIVQALHQAAQRGALGGPSVSLQKSTTNIKVQSGCFVSKEAPASPLLGRIQPPLQLPSVPGAQQQPMRNGGPAPYARY